MVQPVLPMSGVEILTDQIGRELVRLITSQAPAGTFKLCQYGGVERVAEIEKLGKLLPAIFVVPDGEATYDAGFDAVGNSAVVTEHFRISVWTPYDPEDNPLDAVTALAKGALYVLKRDPLLKSIAAAIRPHQIEWSQLMAVDWTPDEGLVLIDTAAAVRCIVMRWDVRWLARDQGP